MKPLYPAISMSSTLGRVRSSVARSRPMGLPRYQLKEKCGPTMLPPRSQTQPTEFLAVPTRPTTLVICIMAWSLTPPHSVNIGPSTPLDLVCCGAVAFDAVPSG
ncbi:Uncharacterised protein [Mycobacteroides abscessus subsp. massiliense]|nr:Uncharacterised protein [Mycobacteroides abscessus subsp. massiliense]